MEYEYPKLIADEGLKRLHVQVTTPIMEAFPDIYEYRKKCDFGGEETYPLIPFMEAVRLINEEAYRPCGHCLEEGGEVSNWKERAERAEADVRGLNSQLTQSDKLAADWKAKEEANYKQLCGLREQLGLEKAT